MELENFSLHPPKYRQIFKKKKAGGGAKNLEKCLKLASFPPLPIQSAVHNKLKYFRTNELENLDLKFYLTASKQDGSSRINTEMSP